MNNETLKAKIENVVLNGMDRLFHTLRVEGASIEEIRDAVEELIGEGRLGENGRFICAPLPDWVEASPATWRAEAGQLIYCRDNPMHRPDMRDRYQFASYEAYCAARGIRPN